MIVDRHRNRTLGLVLTDDIIVEKLLYLLWLGHIAHRYRLRLGGSSLVRNITRSLNLDARLDHSGKAVVDTVITNVSVVYATKHHLNLALATTTKRAVRLLRLSAFLSLCRHTTYSVVLGFHQSSHKPSPPRQ